jgi:hypothetical protein
LFLKPRFPISLPSDMFIRGKVGSVLLGAFPGVFPSMLVVVCVGGFSV